jgi:hypothetical protein
MQYNVDKAAKNTKEAEFISFMLFFFTLLFEIHQHPLQLCVKFVFRCSCTNDLYGPVCNCF